MKNLSKVLAVVLAFAMALSMVSFAAYTDVAEDANYSEAVAVLSDLKILTGYEDGSFKPEATITRAEFATVVIRMLGLADSVSGGSEIFTDVAADHWANGYIALAAQQGIVNGYGDGRFGPEDPVKYQEAIKMVVAALGYTPMADANGGYPGGYKVVASQRGILAGVTGAKDNEAATRAIVAQLAYNSLAVPLMEQTGFGTQTNFQAVNSLLLNKLGVTKFEAKVIGTSASGDTKPGKVKIDASYQITAVNNQYSAVKYNNASTFAANPSVPNTYFTTGVTVIAEGAVEEAAKALLDTAAIVYVKDAGSDSAEVVSIIKDGNRNATVEFMAEDLKANATIDSSCVGVLSVYTDKAAGEYEEYDVDIDTVYVNGQKKAIENISTINATDVLDTDAEFEAVVEFYLQATKAVDVKLLSNGADEDVYNVAYITVWSDAVVDRVSARNYRVYTNAGSITLDPESKTQNFTIYKDGEVADFEDIAENDVLSIAGYISGGELKYGDVYIISEKVEGTVNGKAAGATNEIKVDGTNYKTSATVKSAVKLGDVAVFYVNARGVLVGLDKTATGADLKYGFASYIYEDPNFGDSQIRMLSADGVWATYDVATKFTSFSETTPVAVTKFNLSDSTFAWDTSVAGINGNITGKTAMWAVNNIVAYDLDADGKVKEIYFINAAITDSPFDNTGVATGSLEYKAATGLIGGNEVDDTTVIFNLNGITLNQQGEINEKDVTVVALSALVDRDNYTITKGFNVDEDTNIVGALVGTGIAGGIDWISNFFVVTEDPYETTNDLGEEGIMLTGIKAGEEATLFLNSEDLETPSGASNDDILKTVYGGGSTNIKAASHTDFAASSIAKGDVLIYSVNAKGEAAKVQVLVDASDVATGSAYGSLTALGTTDAAGRLGKVSISGTDYEFVFGYAKALNDTKLTLVSTNDGTSETVIRFSADTIGAIYDKFTGVNGKVVEAIYGDITTDPDINELTDDSIDDGDMVFARVSAGVIVDDFVIIANNR